MSEPAEGTKKPEGQGPEGTIPAGDQGVGLTADENPTGFEPEEDPDAVEEPEDPENA